jgi:uncharacterized protein
MNAQMLAANPRVADDVGRVAVQRGPLVYCLEGLDQPQGVDLSEVALVAGRNEEFRTEFRKDLLDGVVVLRHPGLLREDNAGASVLYSRYSGGAAKTRAVDLTLIPYYAWSNRAPTGMQVWTSVRES